MRTRLGAAACSRPDAAPPFLRLLVGVSEDRFGRANDHHGADSRARLSSVSTERRPERIGRKVIGGSADASAAAVGALLGTLGGPLGIAAGAIGGAAASRVFQWIGGELEQRLLAPRQRQRIATAAEQAALEIERRKADGEAVREDGFFDKPDPEHSAGAELLEGVLLMLPTRTRRKRSLSGQPLCVHDLPIRRHPGRGAHVAHNGRTNQLSPVLLARILRCPCTRRVADPAGRQARPAGPQTVSARAHPGAR